MRREDRERSGGDENRRSQETREGGEGVTGKRKNEQELTKHFCPSMWTSNDDDEEVEYAREEEVCGGE